VLPDRNKAMVEGVNVVKRHEQIRQAPGGSGMIGGIVPKELPVHISNLALVCSSCGKPTRVGYIVTPEGKVRVCKKCGARQ
jgi:large subunit ribosomal protein L24